MMKERRKRKERLVSDSYPPITWPLRAYRHERGSLVFREAKAPIFTI
jgi:hypothetical protein